MTQNYSLEANLLVSADTQQWPYELLCQQSSRTTATTTTRKSCGGELIEWRRQTITTDWSNSKQEQQMLYNIISHCNNDNKNDVNK